MSHLQTIKVTLMFLNGSQYQMKLIKGLPILNQIKRFIENKTKRSSQNLIIMFDCETITENQTCNDIKIQNSCILDCLYKINRNQASSDLINHLISEKFNPNEFQYFC